jgi:hypothetical protein
MFASFWKQNQNGIDSGLGHSCRVDDDLWQRILDFQGHDTREHRKTLYRRILNTWEPLVNKSQLYRTMETLYRTSVWRILG